ncbi:VMAP-C domain-containing protein [Streptomyces sp. 7R007]
MRKRILVVALGAARRGVGGGGGGVNGDLDGILWRIRREAVEALVGVPVLAYPNGRITLLRELQVGARRRLDPVDAPNLQLWCLGVVDLCTPGRGPCLLQCLADALDLVDPETEQTLTVHRLADEWNAAVTLPLFAPKWAWLREKLSGDAAEAARYATDGRVPAAPHCGTAWEVLLHLVEQAALPGGALPWMRLMIRLWQQTCGEPEGRELYALTRRTAGRNPELLAQLDLLVPRAPAAEADSPQSTDYLIIGIAPADREPDRYKVSYWMQSPLDPAPVSRGRSVTVPLDGLEAVVDDIVSRAEDEEGARRRRAKLELEFILPLELLNLPVHEWMVEHTGSRIALAAQYQVVVRSLDRLLNQRWHRVWLQRWQRLHLPGPRFKFMDPAEFPHDTGDLSRLVARLNEDQYVAVVLSEPPEQGRPRGRREATAALSTGMPVLMWHHTMETNEELKRYVRTLIRFPVTDLPTRVAEARRRNLAQSQARNPLTQHLAVLWDDPDRNPYAPTPNLYAPDDPLGPEAL